MRRDAARDWLCSGIGLVALILTGLGAPVGAQSNQDAQQVDRVDTMPSGSALVGLGLVGGEPSGLGARLWLSQSGIAVDTAVGLALPEDRDWSGHAALIYHLALIQTQGGRYILPFVGGGVSGSLGLENRFGLRFPIGLSLIPFRVPIELSAEFAPGLGLWPDNNPETFFGIGLRYYVGL